MRILPVDRQKVDVEQGGKGQSLRFKAKVTVKPEITLGEYKGWVEIDERYCIVSAEDVTEELVCNSIHHRIINA